MHDMNTFVIISDGVLEALRSPEMLETFKRDTDPKWRIDKSKKDTLAPSASFRKLNID